MEDGTIASTATAATTTAADIRCACDLELFRFFLSFSVGVWTVSRPNSS